MNATTRQTMRRAARGARRAMAGEPPAPGWTPERLAETARLFARAARLAAADSGTREEFAALARGVAWVAWMRRALDRARDGKTHAGRMRALAAICPASTATEVRA